jgi:AsmA family/AsmA-like C-terminal region
MDKTMTVDVQRWNKKRGSLWLAAAALAGLLAIIVVPPLVSVGHYKSRIIHLMSESLGRPVRLSSVELRLFPRPGFVLTDLTVEEDPAYGAEPVLHADTVTASIRLLSLWRGRLEIGTISVDNASLNVVRTAGGRWNLDPLFRTAAARAEPAAGNARPGRRATPLPYLEATNSRINFKRGVEKLPFSLVATDLSFWQEQPGDWRIRLRGQPARTDLSLDLADTGLVRLEARAQSTTELRKIPLHVDLEWREAQLGQLMRLVIGSDPGWRGDLTGELHLDGTPDAAQIQTRLRATGVHRAEFAPAAPMDFDASCGFLYHFSAHAVEKLACDSPLGDGRIHLAGELPGNGALEHFSVQVDRIPVAAGLDALRTVRSGFGPGLEAAGTINGKISYAPTAGDTAAPAIPKHAKQAFKGRTARAHPALQGPLTGRFTVAGFQLSGDGLTTPIQASRLVLEPVAASQQNQLQGHSTAGVEPAALEATVTIPAGGTSPLTVVARLALYGYRLTVHGQASVSRARELAQVAGRPDAAALGSLAGEPVTVDLEAQGPWLPKEIAPFSTGLPAAETAGTANLPMAAKLGVEAAEPPTTDSLSGTVTLHNANWKADFLASHVEIAQATLHVGQTELRWDPVVFSYGPVKGTASLDLPAHCGAAESCRPRFLVEFGALDAAALQAAILGAHEKDTLLSTLIARFRPASSSDAPAWPPLEGTVKADALVLGPVTLTGATAKLRILATGAEIADLDADLLGGHVHGGGTLSTSSDQAKPAYTLEGQFEKLSPAAVGQLLGLKWSGGVIKANGKIELSGFTYTDLAASAKGTLHFEWRHGMAAAQEPASSTIGAVPAALTRFDRWTADADIANGTATLKDNEVQQGARKRKVEGALTFGDPPTVSFAASKETQARR